MAKPVIMPKLGFTQETSQIVRWLVQPGAKVDQGDPIVEVTTDKVNMEVEAPTAGILDGVRFKEGDTVPVTEIIAYLRSPDEPPMQAAGPSASDAPAAQPAPVPLQPALKSPAGPVLATPVAANLAQEAGVDLNLIQGTGPQGRVTKQDVQKYLSAQPGTAVTTSAPVAPSPGGKVRAVPAARRLAQELEVDITQVKGSGPRGRVQSADVQAAQVHRESQVPTVAPTLPPAPSETPAVGGVLKTIPLVGMRLTIATRMQQSMQQAPHITFEADIDVTAAEDLRQRVMSVVPKDQPRVSLTAIIAKTCAWALKRHPLINSRLDGQQILVLGDINIGIAVALEEGLIVPVVPAVDRKGLAEIAAEIAAVADRARNGRLRGDDLQNGTFTISNLGMFGVDRFTAIINPPQTAILAVGRVTKRLVPDEEGRPVARPMMTVTLSADHRVVDGATAARFLGDLRVALEHPDLLTV